MSQTKQKGYFAQKDNSRRRTNPRASHSNFRRAQSEPKQNNAMYSPSSMSNLTSSPIGVQVRLPVLAQRSQMVHNKEKIKQKIAWTKNQIEKAENQKKETEDEIDMIDKQEQELRQQLHKIEDKRALLEDQEQTLINKYQKETDIKEKEKLSRHLQRIKKRIFENVEYQKQKQEDIDYNREKIHPLLIYQSSLHSQIKALYENLDGLQDIIRHVPHKLQGK